MTNLSCKVEKHRENSSQRRHFPATFSFLIILCGLLSALTTFSSPNHEKAPYALTVNGTPTSSCVGGSTGTITASASGGTGSFWYQYRLNSGSYQSSTLFTGLSAGTYTLTVKDSWTGLASSKSVTVSEDAASTGDETLAGTNSWIGHMYEGINFNTYIGSFTETESFDETFGGNTTCYPVTSSSGSSSIYTETFSARFRMNSTKNGLYTFDLGSDDGSRLYVDGTLVYNNWNDHAFASTAGVLMNLSGSSSLAYEYYENSGANEVVFRNPKVILANTLSANISQTICSGGVSSTISGDNFGVLPSGLSNGMYQWSYSTTPGGATTNIAGATAATYKPDLTKAPFNTAGTYYVYRSASVTSSNNIGFASYTATNLSNAATITISSIGAATAGVTAQPTCATSTGTIAVTAPTGGGISYSIDGVSYSNTTGNFSGVIAGTYTVTAKNSNGCISSGTNVTVNLQPQSIGNNQLDYTNGLHGTICQTPAENATATFSAPTGTVFTTVNFSSYGTPNGTCNSFSVNASCNAITSQSVTEGYLLGSNSASIAATNGVFTDPCVGTVKKLYIQATYTQPICSGTSPGTITGTKPTGGTGTYTYYWEQSTTSSSSGFSAATGVNNTIDYTPGNLTQTTWYRRTVTSGCVSTSPVIQVSVVAMPATPTIAVSGSTTICAGGSTTLTSSAGTSYLWSTGATTASINVTTAGNYNVKVTNANGCQSTSSVATVVTVNSLPATPTITAGGPITFCAGGNVTLTSSAGTAYLWSTGATTASINVTTSGNYSVKVTNASGCQSTSSAATVTTVNSLPATPTITPGGSTTFCAGGNVTLTSSAGTSYLWSTGATTQSISATTSGSYTVKVTNASGCQSASSVATVVTVNSLPATPTISAGGSTAFCSGGSVSLTSSAGSAYLWSTGATTQSISVTTSGSYTVKVTNASGCQSASSAATVVTVNPLPSATISYSGSPYCSSSGTASPVMSGTSGGAFTSDAGLKIDAVTGVVTLSTSTVGNHTVTYTIAAAGGCAAFVTTTTITITQQPSASGFYPSSPYCSNIGTLTPSGSQTGLMGTLSSDAGLSINSSTGVINVTASTAGLHTVTYSVPAFGGCTAYLTSADITISSAPNATITYTGSPYCSAASTAHVTKAGTGTGTFSSTAGLIIDANSGAVDLNASTPGTYTVTYTVSASSGCAVYKPTASITITPKVQLPVFALGAISTRCQGAGTVTYSATANNSTGITYTLDAVSLAAGNTINSSTGTVSYKATWSGTSTITATAAGCSPLTATHVVTVAATPLLSTTSPTVCVGGSGTITAIGSGGGAVSYTYSLNGGAYQSSGVFSNLALGTYNIMVQSSAGCTASTSVTVSTYPSSTDDQNTYGINSWIGHMYNGKSFNNYIGYFSEAEQFNEGFTGDATCFPVSSSSGTSSIYTEQFSVHFKMNSTKKGLYVVDLGSDDGSKLTIDGNVVYNNWTDQAFTTKPRVLINLTGSSLLNYDYYENGGANNVIFQNLTLVLANTLSTNISQGICQGNSGTAIGGDTFGTLPSGLSNAQYQWTYSLSASGPRTNIAGATSASLTPDPSVAPFNNAGTYYIYRNAMVTSTNNTGVNPYVASNESNGAIITITAIPGASISYADAPFCNSISTAESVTVTGTTGGQFTATSGLTVDAATGAIVPSVNPIGNYTVTYTVPAAGGCSSFTTTADVYIGAPGAWSGHVNTDWNNAGNWLCGQIPSSATDAIIPKYVSNFPTVISNTAEAKDVIIRSGASLIIVGTIKVAGAISNSGSLDVTQGTLEMNGSAAQTIAGSMFVGKAIKNLTVSNTSVSGLSISSTANDTLKISGVLSFGNANSKLFTGNNITLVSNNAGTASVGILGTGNSINGNVTVERFINTGTASGQHAKSWQFLATPATGQSVKQTWMENGIATSKYGTQITGAGGVAAGFDAYTATPSIKYYNSQTDSWIGISNTNNAIYGQTGYMVFVRGDRTVTAYNQAANSTTLRTTGTLLTGNILPITVSPGKFQSVGNPYAAPVDFTLITKDAGIDNQFYVWDPYLSGANGLGGYQTLSAANNWQPVPGGTTSYPSGVPCTIIQSGQAFFVHAAETVSAAQVMTAFAAESTAISFTEDCKATSKSKNFARVAGGVAGNNS